MCIVFWTWQLHVRNRTLPPLNTKPYSTAKLANICNCIIRIFLISKIFPMLLSLCRLIQQKKSLIVPPRFWNKNSLFIKHSIPKTNKITNFYLVIKLNNLSGTLRLEYYKILPLTSTSSNKFVKILVRYLTCH